MSNEPQLPWWAPAAVILLCVVVFGTCGYSAVSCWHRGGSVVKNLFDWPVCVEVQHK